MSKMKHVLQRLLVDLNISMRENTMQIKDLKGLYHQSPKLNQLHILKEIAADATITQAELASRCSLSVAMVNNYMKELCNTGLLEYHRKSIKTVSYYLTPLGARRLKCLNAELINEMVEQYIAAKNQIKDRILSQAHTELRRVILFGCSHLAQLVFHALESCAISILGICDDNIETIGSDFCGREVLKPSQIRFLSPDAVIITDSKRTDEIYQNILSLLDAGIDIICIEETRQKKTPENEFFENSVPSLPENIGQEYLDSVS
jgi:predicted transcriptional regulator